MESGTDIAAPCGMYCGVCGVYIAHRDNNLKFKERLAHVYAVTVEQLACKGCLSDQPWLYCASCKIKACVQGKNIEGCHECGDFPCAIINDFPFPAGQKVIMRAVPFRREHGTQMWMEEEEKRYVCPHCGYKLFRGARTCRKCKAAVDVD